jgi:Kef-type K+ transport system membrane component KefB
LTVPHDDRGRSFRHIATYGGLTVLPVAAAIVVLVVGADGGAARSVAENTHPFARLFLAITVIVVACKLVGMLVALVGQPTVVGEIAAGIVLGPSLLGGIFPAAEEWLLPDSTQSQLQVLAQVGAVLFVFLAGFELDVNRIKGRGRFAVMVSHSSIALPFLFGVLLALVVHGRFAPEGIGMLPFALFLGVALSITALPVLARILLELDMFHSTIGTLVMSCALIDDVTAWILLALVVAVVSASSLFGIFLTIVLTAAFAGALWLLRPALARLAQASGPVAGGSAFHLLLVAVFLAASATEWIGVHAVFGAFLLGMALRADSAVAERLRTMIGGLTSALLLPLFFAYAGLGTDVRLLFGDGDLWVWALVILAVCVLGKFGGSALSARLMGAPASTAGQVGALMNCRGLTGLVVLEVGRELGILSPALFTIMVLVTLATTAMTVPLVRLFQRRNHADVAMGELDRTARA